MDHLAQINVSPKVQTLDQRTPQTATFTKGRDTEFIGNYLGRSLDMTQDPDLNTLQFCDSHIVSHGFIF